MTEALDARLTTGTTEHRADRSGWMMFAVMVQRQILQRVHTALGVCTTVDIAKMSLCGVMALVRSHRIAALSENVFSCEHNFLHVFVCFFNVLLRAAVSTHVSLASAQCLKTSLCLLRLLAAKRLLFSGCLSVRPCPRSCVVIYRKFVETMSYTPLVRLSPNLGLRLTCSTSRRR